VARWRDEIETTVNTIVDDVRLSNNTRLGIEIFFVFAIDVIENWLPTRRENRD